MSEPVVCAIVNEIPSAYAKIALAYWCNQYILVFNLGGGWDMFADGEQHNPLFVEAWMPDGIQRAIAEAVKICPDCEPDLDWFDDWADIARETLDTNSK